jgi:hypothetical protein
VLHAVGHAPSPTRASLSIRFEPGAGVRWGNLYFLALPPDYLCNLSRLDYCVVEGGGGIVFQGSPALSRSAIRLNEGTDGGGMVIYEAPTLEECVIEDNAASGKGGGVKISNTGSQQPVFIGCLIRHNSAGGSGGGVWVSQGGAACPGPEFTDCEILDNTAGAGGGGFFLEDATARLAGCTISQNSCSTYGSALYRNCQGTASRPMTLERCIVSGHGGATAISSHGGSLSLAYCTVSDNTAGYALDYYRGDQGSEILGTIVAGSGGHGLTSDGDATIRYCDFYGNAGGDISGGIPGFGVLTGVNANGDSCDVFMNIFEPPGFVDPGGGDYRLEAASACIDAGDPGSPPDPDGTTADMGALFHGQCAAIGETEGRGRARLSAVYPHPFRLRMRVEFVAPQGERGNLSVYDVKGQLHHRDAGHSPGTSALSRIVGVFSEPS